jgi:integrase/recombinase XerD
VRQDIDVADIDLLDLLDSWSIHLRAAGRSRETIRSYRMGVQGFVRWCETHERSARLDRHTVNAWVASMLDGGAESTTARARQLAVRRLSAWLAEEGEIERDELLGVRPPKLDQKVTERLTDEQMAAMIRTCDGRDLGSRRDEAILRVMFETGARAGEMILLTLDDVDLVRGVVTIRRGKGGKGRVVPFGPQAARALDRYLRLRRSHRLATSPALWLGVRGKSFGYHGLYDALQRRAHAVGIERFHPHLTRHTAAQRWLSAGGSEGGLMTIAGWSRREMLDRYTRATAAERATDEARRLNLGEL